MPQGNTSSEGSAAESADDSDLTGADSLEEAVSSAPQEAGGQTSEAPESDASDLTGDTSSPEVQG